MGSAAFDIGHVTQFHHGSSLAQQQGQAHYGGLQNIGGRGGPGLVVKNEPNENQKPRRCMKSFREYLDKHRDLIFTVAIVFIADHYLLGGALKTRLKGLLEGILNKAESNFHKEIGQ